MMEMTTHERYTRIFAHQEADRIPVIDYPWAATEERWRREGLPEGMTFTEYFGLDRLAQIGANNSPRYTAETLEETEDYCIYTTDWGATMKQWKHMASTPEFLDFTITSSAQWREAKARIDTDPSRVNWAHLDANYSTWRNEGYWIQAGLWFGFDVTHSWMVGTERVLMALVEEPEWLSDMFHTQLDTQLALLNMVWDKGYTFDSIFWPDDMGYKFHTFFSVNTYRALLKPVHKKAIDWAHAKGINAHLHSCGDINPLVPELIDIGLDALNPLEVKAGMDPVHLKQQFGDVLVLHGGINAVLYEDLPALEAEMRRVIPTLKAGGGYIFATDHSVPSNVSLDDFRRVIAVAKEVGAY